MPPDEARANALVTVSLVAALIVILILLVWGFR